MTDLLLAEDYITISAIKPILQHIFEDLLKSKESDTTLTKDMQKIIKDDLEERYSSARGEINLVVNVANFIDPCFKADYLSEDELALVKEEIIVDIDVMDVMDHGSLCDSDTTEEPQQQHQRDADEEPSDTEVTEPPKKRSKTDKLAKGQVKLGQIFKKLKEQKTSTPSTTGIITVSEKPEFELDHYVKSPMADPKSDPLEWWKINNIHYPLLAKIAKKYLSIRATSCPSERLFSFSGKIVSTLRNNLKPEKVNMLVFLSKNLK